MSTAIQAIQGPVQTARYRPGLFPVLDAVPSRSALSKLRNQSYLDWYYSSADYCHLNLVLDNGNNCLACQGRELMTFQIGDRRLQVACLSSFYAFRSGFGFYAFAACLKGCDAGMLPGGTEAAQAFINKAKWTAKDIPGYCFNPHYKDTSAHRLRAAAKSLLNLFAQRTPLLLIPNNLLGDLRKIKVVEQTSYPADLLDFVSAFQFRFDPDLAHLKWRYALDLPFARYRLFQAYSGKSYIGYVILQDKPQEVLVAQADGIEPRLLAAAIVHAIGSAARNDEDARQVILLVLNKVMRDLLESVGFRRRRSVDRLIAWGGVKGPLTISVPEASWLVNYDWGDRGLTRPFPGETGY